MQYYTLKETVNYRVPSVNDALKLRKWLEHHHEGELTTFKYTTKYIKEHGEIIEEFQLVTVTFVIDNEKEPEGVLLVDINEEDEDNG